MKTRPFLWIALIFFFSLSCHKKAAEFQDTFSCQINGMVWTPEGPVAAGQSPVIAASVYNNQIRIFARRDIRDPAGKQVSFDAIGLQNIGMQVSITNGVKDDSYNFDGCGLCPTDTTKVNFVKTIAIDTVQRIVKGVFQFECNESYCRKNVMVALG